jgi:hypothetical protein
MRHHLVLSRVALALVLALVIFGPVNIVSTATTGGPPSGFTNAPGEGNCTACHGGFALNSGTAAFGIAPPSLYTPAAAHAVTVAFTGSSSPKHGFEITARDGAGNPSGTTAYHEHTSAGTALSSWTMNWLAPSTLPPGPVSFYAAGNDTNNNGSPTGDHIYVAVEKLFQATLSTPSAGWSIGAPHTLALSAPGHAGELYYIVPSDDPAPFALGGPFVLEVTPNDIFYVVVPQSPQIFQNIAGNLDAASHATATINVPFHPPLVGLPFHFAAVTATATPSLAATEVTNRLTVTFQ